MNPGSQSQAMQMIGDLLTKPRPGGIPTNNAGMAGMNIGPGIAGVASTSEAEGILIYNERTNYNEWEFIYDPTKEKRIANPNAAVIGTPADKMGTPAGPGANSPNQQQSQPFGTTPRPSTFGQPGSFGNRP
jgi:hypothetical protein